MFELPEEDPSREFIPLLPLRIQLVKKERAGLVRSSDMASRDQKDEPFVPSWDGEVQGWSEYSRRVRLCWSQMPTHKRYTLGPKLVLRLRGKAWESAASVDHSRLCQPDGTSYLLQFLKDKLGRLPVPDVGQHLDELFVRLRRPAGMDLLSWCTQLRESYKRVQRSLG